MVSRETVVPTSIGLPPAVKARLVELSRLNRVSQSVVMRALIMGSADMLPSYLLTVQSTDPLVITGDHWEGRFKGAVRVLFPQDGKGVIVPTGSDILVNGTFQEVVDALHK